MQYRIENIKSSGGSCNGCKRGILLKNGKGLKYPYKKVYILLLNQLEIRLCKSCLNEIRKIK